MVPLVPRVRGVNKENRATLGVRALLEPQGKRDSLALKEYAGKTVYRALMEL